MNSRKKTLCVKWPKDCSNCGRLGKKKNDNSKEGDGICGLTSISSTKKSELQTRFASKNFQLKLLGLGVEVR